MSLGEIGLTLDNHKEEHNTLYKNIADNESTVAMRMVESKSDPRAVIYCPFHENICIRNYQEGMCCFPGKLLHMKCELCQKDQDDAKRKELAFARAEEERLAAVKAAEEKNLSRNNSDILAAVNAWCNNPAAAEAKYGHISKWNTSRVTTMKELFKEKNKFNDDISDWDVSNVKDMNSMFQENSAFTGDISKWNVSNVTDMNSMFWKNSVFTGDISKWNVSNVTNMNWMFSKNSVFTGDISKWNVSNVTNMSYMFRKNSAFTGDISKWNVSNVTNMNSMFKENSAFTGDISKWNVSNVKDMSDMFRNSKIPNQHKPKKMQK